MGRRTHSGILDRTVRDAAYYSQPADDVLDGRAHLAITSRCISEEFEKKWVEFCAFINQDSERYLRSGTYGTYIKFMEWLLDGSGIRRVDVAMSRFVRLQTLYKHKVGSSMDQAIVDRVRTQIQTTLKKKFDLIAGLGPKPVMEIEDLVAVFEYLWRYDTHRYLLERKRVQLAFFILIAAFTSSRPGAILESSATGIKGTGAALFYKDIQLIKLRNPSAGKEFIMALRLTLGLMKGRRDKNTPETYVLHEYDGCFALCPIIHIIALALADNAFKEGYSTVDAVYGVKIPAGVQQISLKWKTDIMDLAVFRTVKKGETTCQALPYHSLAKNWRKLVSDTGFEVPPSFYAIRRGTANVLNTFAPQSILMQAMGHKSPGEFRKSYQSQTIRFDIQSAVLGVPLQTSTVIAAGNELRSRDLRAPIRLSDEQEKLLWDDPYLVELRVKKDKLGAKCEQSYGSRLEARRQSDSLAEDFKKAENLFKSEIKYKRASMLKAARADFFASIPDDSTPTVSSVLQHVIPERTRLATALFTTATTAEETHTSRVSVIQDMFRLCFLEEAPGKFSKIVIARQSDPKRGRVSLRCEPKTCLFCFGKNKDKILSTRSRLCRHLEKIHYPHLPRKRQFECPHPSCHEMLNHISHFQLHAMQVHKIEFTKKSGQAIQKEWAKK